MRAHGASIDRYDVSFAMANILDSQDASIYTLTTKAPGPSGFLPLTPEMLRSSPSGDIFGWTQDAGMGWNPAELGRPEVLILSTQGGIRGEDGRRNREEERGEDGGRTEWGEERGEDGRRIERRE